MKCKSGFREVAGRCTRIANKLRAREGPRGFFKYIDFLLLLPISYSFIATLLNGWVFSDQVLPSIFFRPIFGVTQLYLLSTLTVIGLTWMLIRAARWRNLR